MTYSSLLSKLPVNLAKEVKILNKPINEKLDKLAEKATFNALFFNRPFTLIGPYGYGKTTLALITILRHAWRAGGLPIYLEIHRLCMMLRENYSREYRELYPMRGFIEDLVKILERDTELRERMSFDNDNYIKGLREILTLKITPKGRIFSIVKDVSRKCEEIAANYGLKPLVILDEFERPRITPRSYGYEEVTEYYEDLFMLTDELYENIPVIYLMTPGLLETAHAQISGRLGGKEEIRYTTEDLLALISNFEKVYNTKVIAKEEVARLVRSPRILFNILMRGVGGEFTHETFSRILASALSRIKRETERFINRNKPDQWKIITGHRIEALSVVLLTLLLRYDLYSAISINEIRRLLEGIVSVMDEEEFSKIFTSFKSWEGREKTIERVLQYIINQLTPIVNKIPRSHGLFRISEEYIGKLSEQIKDYESLILG